MSPDGARAGGAAAGPSGAPGAPADAPVVIVNPRAANGRVGRRWASIERTLARELGPFEARWTEHAHHAPALVQAALAAGHRRIASLGGDGTHGQVVQGLFEGDRARAPDATLGVLPVGTGGDLRRNLSGAGGRDLAAFARAFATSPPHPVDVGHLACVDDDGAPVERAWINVASFGLGGVVVRRVNGRSKALGGPLSFFVASVEALLRYRPATVRLVVDGTPLEPLPLLAAAVCNGGWFGGGMHVAPSARVDDGWLDLVVLPWRGAARQLLRGADVYLGRHVRREGVRVIRCREVEAEVVDGGPCLVDVDGESPGRLPFRARVLPGALRVAAEVRRPEEVPA